MRPIAPGGLALLGAIILASAAVAQAPARESAGKANSDPFETGRGLTLPEGRLQLVSGRAGAAFFISLGQVRREGDVVDYWTYAVYAPGHPLNAGLLVQDITHLRLDCQARTTRVLGVAGFDEAGRVLATVPARAYEEEPIEAESAHDFQARVLCDGIALPPQNTFADRKAAYAATRILLNVTD
ncbi:MAG: hypothetical protein GC145_04800 [Caulobacter sp.]|nr:hypothetical protein [Caulobacter sp.]